MQTTVIAAYVLVGGFLVLQRIMRQGEHARSLRAQPADRGTTRLLGAAFGLGIVALAAGPVLHVYGVATIGSDVIVGWIGVAVVVGGLTLRLWSQAVLGRYYTSTLQRAEDQLILAAGPYRVLRHPGYAGMLVAWAGAGLATANWVVVAVITILMVVAYSYRIAAEEAMLLDAFGTRYEEYMRQTWRLMPYVY
jgi:protein-S-isoprenylcysteine O-methyltransferase